MESISESFTASVGVTWTQIGHAPGMIDACEGIHTYKQAMWKKKKGRNILILPSMDIDEAGYIEGSPSVTGQVDTKFYLDKNTVTLDRTGVIRWAHEFQSGQVQASIMHLGGLVLPVVVETAVAKAEWTEDGGTVELKFKLTSGNDHYPIEIAIQFGKQI